MTSSVESGLGPNLLPDAVAVERTLAGDRDAYRILVERHNHNVYRLAYRMAGNSHDAEEIVQEAFLRGYQKLKQFAGQAKTLEDLFTQPAYSFHTDAGNANFSVTLDANDVADLINFLFSIDAEQSEIAPPAGFDGCP